MTYFGDGRSNKEHTFRNREETGCTPDMGETTAPQLLDRLIRTEVQSADTKSKLPHYR